MFKKILFGLIFIAVGALALFWAWSQGNKADQVKTWPKAEGTITESKLEHKFDDGSTLYSPSVKYTYQVGNKNFNGGNINVGGKFSSSSKGSQQKRLDPYPVGAVVPVYYNPQAPEESYLNPEVAAAWLLYLLGLVFLATGIWVMVAKPKEQEESVPS